jgi:hypothetical protein
MEGELVVALIKEQERKIKKAAIYESVGVGVGVGGN